MGTQQKKVNEYYEMLRGGETLLVPFNPSLHQSLVRALYDLREKEFLYPNLFLDERDGKKGIHVNTRRSL